MGLVFARQLAAKGYDLLLVSNREEELDSAKAQLTVNVAEPGVVASGMIDLGHWFDPGPIPNARTGQGTLGEDGTADWRFF